MSKHGVKPSTRLAEKRLLGFRATDERPGGAPLLRLNTAKIGESPEPPPKDGSEPSPK